jgi:magnesium transporter
LRSLSTLIEEFSSHEQKVKLNTIENLYYKLRKHTTQLWQSLSELRETNNSLLSTKQNEVMKIFTILAFVTFPLSLVASIFGMNTKYIPIVGHQYDFWIVMGMMTFATILMFIYFKYKRWI